MQHRTSNYSKIRCDNNKTNRYQNKQNAEQ